MMVPKCCTCAGGWASLKTLQLAEQRVRAYRADLAQCRAGRLNWPCTFASRLSMGTSRDTAGTIGRDEERLVGQSVHLEQVQLCCDI